MDPRRRRAGEGRARSAAPSPTATSRCRWCRSSAAQVFALETPGAKLNYGVNKVRFPNPVRVGSRVRATVTVAEVTDVPAGKQLTLKHVIEIEGEAKPACVAETVVLLLP